MPDFDMHNFVPPVTALKEFGVSADDVTDIIISHAHHDHIEAVRDFKYARIHIQKDEYKSGKGYIPDGAKLNLFDRSTVVGGCVEVIKVGGHSFGSCIALFNFGGKRNLQSTRSGFVCCFSGVRFRTWGSGRSCDYAAFRYGIDTGTNPFLSIRSSGKI